MFRVQKVHIIQIIFTDLRTIGKNWLKKISYIKMRGLKSKITQIEWADACFNDLTGFFLQSTIIDVMKMTKKTHTITDLGILNRQLRITETSNTENDGNITIPATEGSKQQEKRWLWKDVIFQQWLGANTKGINIGNKNLS